MGVRLRRAWGLMGREEGKITTLYKGSQRPNLSKQVRINVKSGFLYASEACLVNLEPACHENYFYLYVLGELWPSRLKVLAILTGLVETARVHSGYESGADSYPVAI